jgi:hypothetical protein
LNNSELIANTAILVALNTALQSADHPVLEDLMDAVGAAITICQAETVGLSFCQGPDASRPPKPLSKQDDASLHLRVPLSPVPPGRQAQPARFDDDETGFDDDEGFMDEDRHNGDHEAASDIDEPMLWLPSQTWPKQLPSQTWTKQLPSQTWTKQLPSQTWPKQLQAKTTASSVPQVSSASRLTWRPMRTMH